MKTIFVSCVLFILYFYFFDYVDSIDYYTNEKKEYLNKAIKGNARSMNELGDMYRYGFLCTDSTIKPNLDSALFWYKEGAKLGDKISIIDYKEILDIIKFNQEIK